MQIRREKEAREVSVVRKAEVFQPYEIIWKERFLQTFVSYSSSLRLSELPDLFDLIWFHFIKKWQTQRA